MFLILHENYKGYPKCMNYVGVRSIKDLLRIIKRWHISKSFFFQSVILNNELDFFSGIIWSNLFINFQPKMFEMFNVTFQGGGKTFRGMMMVHNYTKERKLFLLYKAFWKKRWQNRRRSHIRKSRVEVDCRLLPFHFRKESRKKPYGFVWQC